MRCICAEFEEMDGFYSIYEFERFQKYIEDLVRNESLIPIRSCSSKKYYMIPTERFKCKHCHQIWALKHPDSPSSGSWLKFKPQSVRSALNRLLGFELDI
jgi:hypothetical protein